MVRRKPQVNEPAQEEKMRFVVSRTSCWDSDVAPCEEAKRIKVVRVDERTTDDPAKIPSNKGQSEWWYKEGRNHRVENGRIRRDFDDKAWVVTIKSLDALAAFNRKHGNLVLSPTCRRADGFPEIEIYDNYHE